MPSVVGQLADSDDGRNGKPDEFPFPVFFATDDGLLDDVEGWGVVAAAMAVRPDMPPQS